MLNTNCLDLQTVTLVGDTFKDLPAFMQQQEQSNWCWAATGASVGNYYQGEGTYTQCWVVNSVQGKTTCCDNPDGCNQTGALSEALKATKSFQSMLTSPVSFIKLRGQIDEDKPVCTRVKWNGIGAHVMAVSGYNTSGQKITIQDSWYGTSVIAYAEYPASYQGGGTWTHTYYTINNG